MVQKGGKTFIQLKWPQNEKGRLETGIQISSFHFWYLKSVPINSALNSASSKLT